jgi:hypothetical protein
MVSKNITNMLVRLDELYCTFYLYDMRVFEKVSIIYNDVRIILGAK